MMNLLRMTTHRLMLRLKRQRVANTAPGFAWRAMPVGLGVGVADRSVKSGKSEVRKPSSQTAYGQRVEDLTRMLGKNSGKFQDGVKVPTVSHPIMKEDLTRRST